MSSSLGGVSSSGGVNLYQLLMQELQSSSLGTSISTQSSLSASSQIIDQILFSGASVSTAPALSSGNALDAFQQYLAQAYQGTPPSS